MDMNHNFYKKYEDYSTINCNVTLKNRELWEKFHELDTEMIITKSGRRMFPSLHVQVVGLDPLAHYCIFLEFNPASRCRFKYSSSVGWAPAGTEEAQSPHRVYLHPDSPALGEYWMSQPISFGRLKLTNTPAPPSGHVVLSSMHKYQPTIVIAKTSDPRAAAWSPSKSIAFPETQFIAVTAYQNEKITKLKIDNNPFAKGFRENGQSKCKKRKIDVDDKDSEFEKATKEVKIASPLREEEDRFSCPSSPESLPKPNVASPKYQQSHCSVSVCNNVTQPVLPVIYPYYIPYHYYTTPLWGNSHPFYYQNVSTSPLSSENLTIREPTIKEKPRKITDFSIRAITGYS